MNQYIPENFRKENLLQLILDELSKDHLGDDNLKMTTFLTAVSGLSYIPKFRKSIAVKGDSSVGKDNLILTVLKHIPKEKWIFLTSGTQATIEDDIKNIPIIAFSEVNANREAGANKYLVEIIKQKAEGGTSSIKKDKRKDNKEARHDIGEQATILFGTTESEKDEELKTRFIEGSIEADSKRIEAVNDKTIEESSDLRKLIGKINVDESWISKGLRALSERKFVVILPFLKNLIGKNFIDNHNPRSQRDLKRLIALTYPMVLLFKEQRKVESKQEYDIIYGEPEDFIQTIRYTREFFNQSYSGFDARLSKVLDLVGEQWTPRDEIETKLDISKNTIKKYCKMLAEEGCIEGVKGEELNNENNGYLYHNNKIYYKKCQKHIKKELIRYQENELRGMLEKSDLTPFSEENISKTGCQKYPEDRLEVKK